MTALRCGKDESFALMKGNFEVEIEICASMSIAEPKLRFSKHGLPVTRHGLEAWWMGS